MPSINGNWVDLVIILTLFYFAWEGWRLGLLVYGVNFISFLGSLVLSLKLYKYLALLLKTNFSLSRALSNALGFLLFALLIEAILSFILAKLVHVLFTKRPRKKKGLASLNNLLGILPGVGEGIVLTSFFLTLFLAFPVRPAIKKDISESKVGGFLVNQTASLEKGLGDVFGGVIDDSLTYFTLKPDSGETITLESGIDKLAVDTESEKEMFALVNGERQKRGLKELVRDDKLTLVARSHARDMWERNYFSHYSPEGENVGDRLAKEEVSYSFAGENLALAPTLQTAHTGLMNSEGHRENILEVKFKKVGIGVIDNGIYGKMFVQVFTD